MFQLSVGSLKRRTRAGSSWLARPLPRQPLVESVQGIGVRFDRVAVDDTSAGGGASRLPIRGVESEYLHDRLGQLGFVTRRDQRAQIGERFRTAANRRGDTRDAAGHRLEQ